MKFFYRLLVSKLENLKAEKGHCDQINYDESPPLSLPKTKMVKIISIKKEGSKDEFELSAGSFTQDLETNPQPRSHSHSLDSSDIKLEVPESCMIKKQRGKRKRKGGTWDMKEGTVESENLGSSSGVQRIETSTSGGCVRSSGADGEGPQLDDLVGIFNSVTENQYALVFRRRLDSQVMTSVLDSWVWLSSFI